MADNLISQGVELMLFGMGTVVVFLTLLVFITSGMSALVAKYWPPPEPAAPASPAVDGRTLAVISAAIHQHRSTHKTGNRQS